MNTKSQLARMRDILARITYKPGWKLEPWYTSRLRNTMAITISFDAPNVHRPTETIRIEREHHISVDSLMNWDHDDLIVCYLFSLLRETEFHETQEWFKYDGKHVYEPHTVPQ